MCAQPWIAEVVDAAWALQSDTPSWKSIGYVNDGKFNPGYSVNQQKVLGGRLRRIAGAITPVMTVNFEPTKDSIDLIKAVLNASYPSGTPADLMFKVWGGADYLGTLDHAKIAKLSLSCKVDGPLECSIDIMAAGLSEGSGAQTAVEPTSEGWRWSDGTVTVDGDDDMGCQSFSLTIDNNLGFRRSISPKEVGAKRLPDEAVQRGEAHEIALVLLKSIPWDLAADRPDQDLTFSVAFEDGETVPNTLSVSYTDLMLDGDKELPFKTEGDVELPFKLIGIPGCCTMA